MKLSPPIKGIITAAAMIAIALITYYSGLPPDSPFQYLVYALYALGIIWTLVAYKNFSKVYFRIVPLTSQLKKDMENVRDNEQIWRILTNAKFIIL